MLTSTELELLDYANALDSPGLVRSLKLLHDVVTYYSHEPIGEEEKTALFHFKGLWECMERIIREEVQSFEKGCKRDQALDGTILLRPFSLGMEIIYITR